MNRNHEGTQQLCAHAAALAHASPLRDDNPPAPPQKPITQNERAPTLAGAL